MTFDRLWAAVNGGGADQSAMAEEGSLIQHALDLFVYAPTGLAITALEELPHLIEKGRRRLGGQVETARTIGQFAVTTGQRRAGRVVSQVTDRLARPQVPRSPAGGRANDQGPSAASDGAQSRATVPGPDMAVAAGAQVPDTSALAIPGYDSLSASQVVQRLGGLTTDELDAVREYEALTRGRKTILHRVAQLQAAPSP